MQSQPFTLDGLFLNSSESVVASNSYPQHPLTPGSIDTPASFRDRRLALRLSAAQLGALLGISASNVEMIETVALGEEVAFLHNLTLALLELGGLESNAA